MTHTILLHGLSGSGKTTLAERLTGDGTIMLDGDAMRNTISSDLGYSMNDRLESHRRAASIAALLNDQDRNVVMAMLAPTAGIRAMIRDILGDRLIEIYLSTPIGVCMDRDPKGLYAKARHKDIFLTGMQSPFEEPERPDLVLDTSVLDIQECVSRICQCVRDITGGK